MDTQETTLTPTPWNLFERLKDPDDAKSWSAFLSRYQGLIHRAAVRAGCTPCEAEEVVQETAISVVRRISVFEASPRLGTFEGWLLRLTRCRVVDQFRKRLKGTHLPTFSDGCPTPLEAEIDESGDRVSWTELERSWESEWQQHCLQTALTDVRGQITPLHFEVFHRCLVLMHPASEVATQLNTAIDQVYLIKHRVLNRVRKEVLRTFGERKTNYNEGRCIK